MQLIYFAAFGAAAGAFALTCGAGWLREVVDAPSWSLFAAGALGGLAGVPVGMFVGFLFHGPIK